MNFSGSGKYSGSLCIANGLKITKVSLGRCIPSIVTSCVTFLSNLKKYGENVLLFRVLILGWNISFSFFHIINPILQGVEHEGNLKLDSLFQSKMNQADIKNKPSYSMNILKFHHEIFVGQQWTPLDVGQLQFLMALYTLDQIY